MAESRSSEKSIKRQDWVIERWGYRILRFFVVLKEWALIKIEVTEKGKSNTCLKLQLGVTHAITQIMRFYVIS